MRFFGAILLVCTSYFCGRRVAQKEGKILSRIQSLLAMLKYIQRRIKAERLPLFSLFSVYEDRLLEEIGFLPIMRSCRSNPKELWKNAVSTLAMEGEIERELLFFGNELGELSLEEQLKRLDVIIDFLENEKQKQKEALPAKQKTTRTIWALGGILTAIVLL